MKSKEWLRGARHFLGLKGEDIAKEMHTTKQTISMIELGKSTNKCTIAFYERILMDHLKERGLKDWL